MAATVWGMIGAGVVALLAGLILVRARVRAASGAAKVIALGPVFEAVALAMFAAEHFFDARDLAPIVPPWLPWPMVWTYVVGLALLAAAVSFIAWRSVRWSAALLALLFAILVAALDLPEVASQYRDRLFWTLTVRETAFASGALVLAGAAWGRPALARLGRGIVAAVMIFYGIEHFVFPHNVPGVPLEKLTPAWIPAPAVIAGLVGATLVLAGIGLFVRRAIRAAAASAGAVLVVLTLVFYTPILATEIHSELALEGVNYVGDTLLFAATVLLAGFGA